MYPDHGSFWRESFRVYGRLLIGAACLQLAYWIVGQRASPYAALLAVAGVLIWSGLVMRLGSWCWAFTSIFGIGAATGVLYWLGQFWFDGAFLGIVLMLFLNAGAVLRWIIQPPLLRSRPQPPHPRPAIIITK